MKILLYICSGASLVLGIYELTWIGRSNIAIVISMIAFILAINSFALARKEIIILNSFRHSIKRKDKNIKLSKNFRN